MQEFKIKWKKSAFRELSAIPKEIGKRIFEKSDELKVNPYLHGAIKMAGTISSYRLRISDYRIIYTVYKTELVIEIVKVAHRKEAYKKL